MINAPGSIPIDYPSLGEVADEIGKYLIRWGRVDVHQTKSKFHTIRVYCTLGINSLHQLTHPGYSSSRYPQWLWKFDLTVMSKVFRLTNKFVVPYHEFLYRRAYKRAVKKYPLYRKALISGADYPKLLEGL